MRPDQFGQFVEEPVTVLTEGERIEGRLVHLGQTRLSDFLNSAMQAEAKFMKVKGPSIYCRKTGVMLMQVPFLLVSRDRIVMVMTHSSTDPDHSFMNPPHREVSELLA
jgi:hypothetical protein